MKDWNKLLPEGLTVLEENLRAHGVVTRRTYTAPDGTWGCVQVDNPPNRTTLKHLVNTHPLCAYSDNQGYIDLKIVFA